MLQEIILFFIGFPFLIKGADFLVEGASSVARRFRVSSLFIGLTIVAFGTSFPELIVNIFASLQGAPDLAISNIIGSNIANTLLILGAAAIFRPIVLSPGTAQREIPLSFLAGIVVLVMANDFIIDNAPLSVLSRIDGIILIAFFSIFLYYAFAISGVEGKEEAEKEKISLLQSVLMIGLGLVGLFFGGKWVVDGAVFAAGFFGVSETLIGLTIVAVGTSLPELVTSIVAALKKEADIAVGNVLGSNIFNIFWVLGLSALINPIPFNAVLNFDIIFFLISTILFLALAYSRKKYELDYWEGGIMLFIYVAYVFFLISRG